MEPEEEEVYQLNLTTAELQHVVNGIEARLDGYRRLAHVIDKSAPPISELEKLLVKLKGSL